MRDLAARQMEALLAGGMWSETLSQVASVAYSSDLGMWVAIGVDGKKATSSDSVTWTVQP